MASRTQRVRRLAPLVAGTALVGAGVLFASEPSGAAPVSETFSFTGAPETFVVPANVCQVTVDAFGAQGGLGADNPGQNPGLGGRATATVTVTPGETLVVRVGGAGGDGTVSAGAVGDGGPGEAVRLLGNGGLPGPGGFNGGGDGAPTTSDPGGGGGGASDVRQGGTALEHRAVVAGGGGGGGGDTDSPGEGQGGVGGGLNGGDGAPSEPDPASLGGSGGSQTAGGAGGASDPNSGAGALGDGGVGGIGDADNDGGGGGGGGLFGGGGGAGDFGGTGDAGGGGGGSGFGPAGTAFERGVRAGDGEVTLTYDPDTGAGCTAAPAGAVDAVVRFTG